MSTTTCPFHGENTRPRVCKRCAILEAKRNKTSLRLDPTDAGKLVRIVDDAGNFVSFRMKEGETLDLEREHPAGWDRV